MMRAYFLIWLPVAIVIHECAHGWVAYKLGDPTAKEAGRLTLNPLAHIDLMGTIIFPLLLILMRSPFLFAWAKPVPVDFRRLRNPKRDMIWVGLAGPASNFAIAFLLAILLQLNLFFAPLLLGGIFINLILAVFNLIPIPPLDGSRILMGILPYSLARNFAQLERYGFLILFAFLWLGVFGKLVLPIVFRLMVLLGVRV